MKYKVGDKVRIKDTARLMGIGAIRYNGCIAEIIKVCDDHYHIDIDKGLYIWNEDTFEDAPFFICETSPCPTKEQLEAIFGIKRKKDKDMKTLKVTPPDGYEIDKENSSFEEIKFKKIKNKYPKWEDIKHIEGYCIEINSDICIEGKVLTISKNRNLFLTEKHAKSALAMAQISQLMPYYGGEITDEEWEDATIGKHIITKHLYGIMTDKTRYWYYLLSFHTAEQRDAFLENNKQLVKDYLMIE